MPACIAVLPFLRITDAVSPVGHRLLVACNMSLLSIVPRINKCSLVEGRRINASGIFPFMKEHKGVGEGKV